MAIFSKNDIIELKHDLTVGEKQYVLGEKFVVQKTTPTKCHISCLGANGEIISNSGLSGSHKSISNAFKATYTAFKRPKPDYSAYKKGNIYCFNKDYGNGGGIFYPKGTRVALVKGGASPSFETLYKQQSVECKYTTGLDVTPDFINKHLEPADAVVCELTKGFSLKGLKEQQGQGGRKFQCNIYYKTEKIGFAENDGNGSCYKIHVKSEAWNELLKKAYQVVCDLKRESSSRLLNHQDMEEIIVEFLIENRTGLTDLKHYLEIQ